MKRYLLRIMLPIIVISLALTVFAFADKSEPQTIEVGIPVEEHPELFLTRSLPTHGEGKIAVFLIDFPDYKNKNKLATKEYYEKLYFSGGIKTSWGNNESVASFYKKESNGKLNLSGEVFDWYTAKNPRSYYDNKQADLVLEAAEYYANNGTDFSKFDADTDGVIDAITFHFAGDYSYSQNDPWYSGRNISERRAIGSLEFTNVCQINEEATNSATPLIKTICHELMHSLGMYDLYGKVYSSMDPTSDLMSKNENTVNPYTKILLGWIDSVKVITSDAKSVTLGVYGGNETGDVALVTDKFDGLFGEFFLVAYRKFGNYTTPVIWHIDARLDKSGKSFMNDNLIYDPRPDKDNPHGISNPSPYLFIEELSADPEYNFVLKPPSPDESAFSKDSVLGPNSFPSSDTHDGRYTGIKIYGFTENNKKTLTFNVSFVNDSSAPVIATKDDELEFVKTVTLRFNERIYKGGNWNEITVKDSGGSPIPSSVIIPGYPGHEIEITFSSDFYKDGYSIYFPEGAVCDSSGNAMKAVTVTASKEHYLFPEDSSLLPGADEHQRNNGWAYFFPHNDHIVVITDLWETVNGQNVFMAKIEFMHLDHNGNVLSQAIGDNPFDNSIISGVRETDDGNYIFFCQKSLISQSIDLIFCTDDMGNLKWTNDSYKDSGTTFSPDSSIGGYTSIRYSNAPIGGLVIRRNTMLASGNRTSELVFIDSKSGKMHLFTGDDPILSKGFYKLTDDLLLTATNTKAETILRLYDASTKTVLSEVSFASLIDIADVLMLDNENIILRYSTLQKTYVVLLDRHLNILKSTELSDNVCTFDPIGDDGLCIVERISSGNHDNSQFHVKRFDRYLNVIWESDVRANFVYYFRSSSEDILAYRSYLNEKKDVVCYIDNYGNEDKYTVEHVHDLITVEDTLPTCTEFGLKAHRKCTLCGLLYSLDDQATEISMQDLIIAPIDHRFDEWIIITNPTCRREGSKKANCTDCGYTVTETIAISYEHHSFDDWTVLKEATCKSEGSRERVCRLCRTQENDTIPPTENHTPGNWRVTTKPTAEAEGEEAQLCSVCMKIIDRRPLDKLSSFTDKTAAITTVKDPNETPSDNQNTPSSSSGDTLIIVIGATAAVALASVGAALMIKKRKNRFSENP